MSEKLTNSKRSSYWRLLGYAKPYKYKLAAGILAGFLVGGSMFTFFAGFSEMTAVNENNVVNVEEVIDKVNPVSNSLSTIDKVREYAGEYGIPVDKENGRETWQFLTLCGLGFVFTWLMKSFGTYLNRLFTRWVGARVVADLREEAFDNLMQQSLKFYGKNDIGQLISRSTNDTAAIQSAVANSIADATRCPIEIIACFFGIVYASMNSGNYMLPVMLFFGLPVILLPLVVIGRMIRKIYRRTYDQFAGVVGKMHEVFTGITVVKAYHAEERETEKFSEINEGYFKTVIHALKLQLIMNPLMEFVGVTVVLAFLIFSYSQGVSVEQLFALLTPAMLAYEPIKKLSKINTNIQRSMAAADRYFELIDTDTSVTECEKPKRLEQFKDKISFSNATFSYDGKVNIIDGINVDIKRGKVVAVVGETGSGKTTIANLIARFYDLDSGSLTIDDLEVKELEIASLRSLIGIVTQDTILFNDTIANNIAYGCPDASREEIIEAAKKANAHDFIIGGHHSEDYNTIVGEKGFKLSGGEKQRVAIARAILKNPPILILDEATSALDTVTEKLVQEALDTVMENRTVFAIAHRLSTIKHADNIIVLEKGHIVESGTHEQLMDHGGRYKKLCDTQFGIS